MKTIVEKSSKYIDFGIENNDKDHKLKVGNQARRCYKLVHVRLCSKLAR